MLRNLRQQLDESRDAFIKEVRQFGHDDDAVSDYVADRFAWVSTESSYIDTKTFEFIRESQLKDLIAPACIQVTADSLVKSLKERMYTSDGFIDFWATEYRPDKELVWQDVAHRRFLNSYKPMVIEPLIATTEENQMIDDFFECLVADEEERYELQQWIAQAVLKPESPNRFACLLFGKSNGTGKGVIQQLLIDQMRDYFKPNDSGTWVKGNFHDGVIGKRLLILDELYADGKSLNDKLKTMISEDEFEVQPKGKSWIKMKNFLNIIASSNEPNPLYIDQSDRRWFAIKTELPNENESKDHADNQEYTRKVSEFAEWARTEQGIRVIRHFLTGIILDDWDTRKPPMTQAKQSLLDTSVSIAEDIALNMDFASPIVRRKDVFNSDEFKYQSIGVGKQEQILASVGCQRVQGDKVQIQGLGRQRDFWITPIGLELGIKPDMTGSQISELIKPHVPDFMETVFT